VARLSAEKRKENSGTSMGKKDFLGHARKNPQHSGRRERKRGIVEDYATEKEGNKRMLVAGTNREKTTTSERIGKIFIEGRKRRTRRRTSTGRKGERERRGTA